MFISIRRHLSVFAFLICCSCFPTIVLAESIETPGHGCPIAIPIEDGVFAVINESNEINVGLLVESDSTSMSEKIVCRKPRGGGSCIDTNDNCKNDGTDEEPQSCVISIRRNGNEGPCVCVKLPKPAEPGS